MKNPSFSFKINSGLLCSGLATVLSGFFIQIHYHIGSHGGIDFNNAVLGLNHSQWLLSHKISIIAFSFYMTYHVLLHWSWFKVILRKSLIAKNKQIFILSTIFILAAITGFIPWFLTLTSNQDSVRNTFIEIHDKIGLILIVYLILHISKRLKWFKSNFRKLINDQSTPPVI
jgi:hypothetical protein